MPLLKTPEVTTASKPYRSAVVAVVVRTQATRPPHFRTLPVISVRTAMTAPTHSLSVRPEHLPVPPDWVLRLRIGSASTQQVASPRLTPGYRADRDLPGRGPCTPLEVRVSARDVHPTSLMLRGGEDLVERLPEAEPAVTDGEFRGDREPTAFRLDEQFAPALRAFPHADPEESHKHLRRPPPDCRRVRIGSGRKKSHRCKQQQSVEHPSPPTLPGSKY